MTHRLNQDDLEQFTGSETWYRHGMIRSILYTDGAKYVAETGGAYWLLDEIALAQRFNRRVAAQEFQTWKLTVNAKNNSARLCCGDCHGNTVYRKRIPWTDFPLAEIEFWVENKTIYLPSER